MRIVKTVLLLTAIVLMAGCSSRRVVLVDPDPSPRHRTSYEHKGRGKAKGPRSLKVPPGHYPPPGQCRLWYPGRPPGHQPRPVPCRQLRGRVLGTGAFILYNGSPWDSDYDWRAHERRRPGTVPAIIIEITGRRR